MLNRIKESYKHIPYTFKHMIMFAIVEKKLTGKIRFKSLFHDIDKILMYAFLPFLGTKEIGKIHRRHSTHHHSLKRKTDYLSMVIDWECCRFTKPDKPMNARETMESKFPHLRDFIEPILSDLGL